jgi:citrate lyase subunit beta-like protein
MSTLQLHTKRLQAIVIPKVQSAKDIQFVSRMIDSVAPESKYVLLHCICNRAASLTRI